MKDVLEQAIIILTSTSSESAKADDAMKFSQAALNLAHVLATIANV